MWYCSLFLLFRKRYCEVPGTATVSLLQKLIKIKGQLLAKGVESTCKGDYCRQLFFVSLPSAWLFWSTFKEILSATESPFFGICLCFSVILASSWLHISPLEFSLRPKCISVVVSLSLAAPMLVLRCLIPHQLSALPHVLLQKMELIQTWSIYQCP